MNITKHPIYRGIYDLCRHIEELPPSPLATALVIRAGKLEEPADLLYLHSLDQGTTIARLVRQLDVAEKRLVTENSTWNARIAAADRLQKLTQDNLTSWMERHSKLERLASFLASVIKSGEPWSPTCETEFNNATSEKAESPVKFDRLADGASEPHLPARALKAVATAA